VRETTWHIVRPGRIKRIVRIVRFATSRRGEACAPGRLTPLIEQTRLKTPTSGRRCRMQSNATGTQGEAQGVSADRSCSANVYVCGAGSPSSLTEVLPAGDPSRDGRDNDDALSSIPCGLHVINLDPPSPRSENDGNLGNDDPSSFCAVEYFRLLHHENPVTSSVLMTCAETASTQSSLQRRAGLVRDGTVFVADKQLGGRGRGSNVWSSPDGCLMFSMSIKYPGGGLTLPFVQYAVSLAVVQTIEAISADVLRGRIRIKWPNDIYFSDGGGRDGTDGTDGTDDTGVNPDHARFLKIGGILCHSAFKHGGFFMTIGVGLNVDNSQPTTCLNDLMREYGANALFTREALVAGIVRRVQAMLPAVGRNGFGGFEAEYYRAWLHTGQVVQVQDDLADDCNGRPGGMRQVRIVGLADNGYLKAEGVSAEGSSLLFELSPDGNSLDFLSGLLAKKIM
jgi:biotin--protein ligase